MERFEIVVDDEGNYCGLLPSENGSVVKAADAQATVEALQADNRTYINERHENMKQIEELRQQVEALQRERDDAEGRFQATFNAYAELKAALTPAGGGQDGNAKV